MGHYSYRVARRVRGGREGVKERDGGSYYVKIAVTVYN